ncbi:MAG TPA: hypothetical protein PLR82_07100 [Bacillota bacterium]|nr:hypothetical protein [Bacillota bacterium]
MGNWLDLTGLVLAAIPDVLMLVFVIFAVSLAFDGNERWHRGERDVVVYIGRGLALIGLGLVSAIFWGTYISVVCFLVYGIGATIWGLLSWVLSLAMWLLFGA